MCRRMFHNLSAKYTINVDMIGFAHVGNIENIPSWKNILKCITHTYTYINLSSCTVHRFVILPMIQSDGFGGGF